MTVALQSALVRIWDNENQIIGAGFLMTERHVLTCAHVVSGALAEPRQEMPTSSMQLDIPFVKAGERVTAVVTLWQPKNHTVSDRLLGYQSSYYRYVALLAVECFAPVILKLAGKEIVVEVWKQIKAVESMLFHDLEQAPQ